MPKDSTGKHHPNIQRAMAADKARGPKGPEPMPKGPEMGAEHESPMEHEGGESPVHAHLKAMHSEMGGKHMHVHHDGMGGITSHHVGEDGEVQGPHNHDNIEALKSHMDQFLNEEGAEGADWTTHPPEMAKHGGY